MQYELELKQDRSELYAEEVRKLALLEGLQVRPVPKSRVLIHLKRNPNGVRGGLSVKFLIHHISERFLSHTPPFPPPRDWPVTDRAPAALFTADALLTARGEYEKFHAPFEADMRN